MVMEPRVFRACEEFPSSEAWAFRPARFSAAIPREVARAEAAAPPKREFFTPSADGAPGLQTRGEHSAGVYTLTVPLASIIGHSHLIDLLRIAVARDRV